MYMIALYYFSTEKIEPLKTVLTEEEAYAFVEAHSKSRHYNGTAVHLIIPTT